MATIPDEELNREVPDVLYVEDESGERIPVMLYRDPHEEFIGAMSALAKIEENRLRREWKDAHADR